MKAVKLYYTFLNSKQKYSEDSEIIGCVRDGQEPDYYYTGHRRITQAINNVGRADPNFKIKEDRQVTRPLWYPPRAILCILVSVRSLAFEYD